MTSNIPSIKVIARASVERQLLEARTAAKHLSLASFAHELELVQESLEFDLATRRDVTKAEDRLIAAWRDLIDWSSPDTDSASRAEVANARPH